MSVLVNLNKKTSPIPQKDNPTLRPTLSNYARNKYVNGTHATAIAEPYHPVFHIPHFPHDYTFVYREGGKWFCLFGFGNRKRAHAPSAHICRLRCRSCHNNVIVVSNMLPPIYLSCSRAFCISAFDVSECSRAHARTLIEWLDRFSACVDAQTAHTHTSHTTCQHACQPNLCLICWSLCAHMSFIPAYKYIIHVDCDDEAAADVHNFVVRFVAHFVCSQRPLPPSPNLLLPIPSRMSHSKTIIIMMMFVACHCV